MSDTHKKINAYNTLSVKYANLDEMLDKEDDQDKREEMMKDQQSVLIKGILSVLFYASFTSTMVFLNKAVLSGYNFHDISLLLFMEYVVTLVAIVAVKPVLSLCGWELNLWNFGYLKKIWILAILMLLNVGMSLWALGKLSVPLFNVLRRLQTLFVLLIDVCIYKRAQKPLGVLCILTILVGAVLSSWGDMNSSVIGIIVAISSVAVFAFQLQIANQLGNDESDKIHPLEMNYYQSFVIIPITLVVCLFTGSFQTFSENPYIGDWTFWVLLVVFCISANLLVVSQLMCTVNNSALTTSITSSVTAIVTTIGALFLMGLTLTPLFVSGVCVAMVGVAGYTTLKFIEARSKHQESKAEEKELELVDNYKK